MADNFLKLNGEKTEFMIFGTKQQSSKVTANIITIGNIEIIICQPVRNIGVFLDSNLSLESQVNHICRTACGNLRNIGRIRKYLHNNNTSTLIHVLAHRD